MGKTIGVVSAVGLSAAEVSPWQVAWTAVVVAWVFWALLVVLEGAVVTVFSAGTTGWIGRRGNMIVWIAAVGVLLAVWGAAGGWLVGT